MRVLIKRDGNSIIVDPVDRSGSPRVGVGTTIEEALGDFLIGYQTDLGVQITVDPSAAKDEDARRQKALGRR